MLTVNTLKKLLNGFDDNLPIVRVGHFGEPYFYDEFDFNIATIFNTKDKLPQNSKVLNIEPPYIGEEPD